MEQQTNVLDAARRLAAARLNGGLVTAEEAGRPQSEVEAYEIQERVHEILTQSDRGYLVGYKIGMTSQHLQRQFGLIQPGTGGILANCVHVSGSALHIASFKAPGAECEIVLTLGRDLTHGDDYTREAVADAVVACHAGIEIVDNRYLDLPGMDGASLIADDLLGAACVIGPPCLPTTELTDLFGELRIGEAIFATGSTKELMGHPHNALAWLANHLSRRGRPLLAGQFVMCGSVAPVTWLNRPVGGRPVVITATFSGLQPVSAQLV